MDSRHDLIFDYDVCLSFASEDRVYVRKVAARIQQLGVRVFFDEYEQVQLWGKDLYTHLDYVYRQAARYCVLFVSQHYARRVWTNHERRSAQARALTENQEYLLPARFDSTELAGLPPTVGYIDLRRRSPIRFAELLFEKLRSSLIADLPDEPDRLFDRLGVQDGDKRMLVAHRAQRFLTALRRMSIQERRVVIAAFQHGCDAELPENVHQSVDLLRRIIGLTPARILRILAGLKSLGFSYATRTDDGDRFLVLNWDDYSAEHGGPSTDIAWHMIDLAASTYCEEHGREAMDRLDFSRLSSRHA